MQIDEARTQKPAGQIDPRGIFGSGVIGRELGDDATPLDQQPRRARLGRFRVQKRCVLEADASQTDGF